MMHRDNEWTAEGDGDTDGEVPASAFDADNHTTGQPDGDVVYVGREFVPRHQATVSLFDHAYLYGDGVFEGVRVYNGHIFRLEAHIKRLLESAHALGFRLERAGLTIDSVVGLTREICRRNDHANGYIRITMSRGTGLGLDPAHIDETPHLIIMTQQLALHAADAKEQGLTMMTCSTRVPPPDVINPRIKGTGKYINNILAKMEANRAGVNEGLMLNAQGYVAEATGENLFIVRDGLVVTPPPSAGCLKGITRAVATELLAQHQGITVREENLTLHDLYTADECFLTGTAAEIVPGVLLDGRAIGTGRVGDVTRRLMQAFHTLTQGDGTGF